MARLLVFLLVFTVVGPARGDDWTPAAAKPATARNISAFVMSAMGDRYNYAASAKEWLARTDADAAAKARQDEFERPHLMARAIEDMKASAEAANNRVYSTLHLTFSEYDFEKSGFSLKEISDSPVIGASGSHGRNDYGLVPENIAAFNFLPMEATEASVFLKLHLAGGVLRSMKAHIEWELIEPTPFENNCTSLPDKFCRVAARIVAIHFLGRNGARVMTWDGHSFSKFNGEQI